MNSEPSRRHMYLLGTEDINESNPVLYNLHIVEGYDLAGAIREYSELYNLDDTYENPVVIREVEQWRGEGPLSGFGVRPRPDRTKPEQDDESHEEETMKEAIVKGDRSEVTVKERKSLDIVEYTAQFNIGAADLECDMPYILEITTDDNFERRVIIITDIGTDHIDYKYWTEDEDGVRCPKRATLLPHFFQKGTCKLYRITEEDLK